MGRQVLIAGIGNIFLGDDAFGVEVVRCLADRVLAERVKVIDYGIRGLDLAYALVDGWDAVILVDAAPRGSAPGTVYVIEPELQATSTAPPNPAIDGHQMDPLRVLHLAASMGAALRNVFVVACEPSPLDGSDVPAGLSPAVEAALPRAVELVESLAAKLLSGETVSR